VKVDASLLSAKDSRRGARRRALLSRGTCSIVTSAPIAAAELHRHVTRPPAHDAHAGRPLALPLTEGRVRRDPGARGAEPRPTGSSPFGIRRANASVTTMCVGSHPASASFRPSRWPFTSTSASSRRTARCGRDSRCAAPQESTNASTPASRPPRAWSRLSHPA